MTKADHLVIEVRYVALPANELEERRTRLRSLLVRAALRLVHQERPCESEEKEIEPIELKK
jgi:hypothetical protein